MTDNDPPGDWPIHHLAKDPDTGPLGPYSKDIQDEIAQSIKRALLWQQQEAEAAAKACRYLQQAANGEVPHDD